MSYNHLNICVFGPYNAHNSVRWEMWAVHLTRYVHVVTPVVCFHQLLTLPPLGFSGYGVTGRGSMWPTPYNSLIRHGMNLNFGIQSLLTKMKTMGGQMFGYHAGKWWRHYTRPTSASHNSAKNFPIFIIFSPKCHIYSKFSNEVSFIGV